ncbi:MAG: polyphosphate kinase 2 [Microthrixaceae bacterium]
MTHASEVPEGELSIEHMEGAPPYPDKIKNDRYLEELTLLQIELLKVQQWVKDSGQRIVILFEGRDAAGKGGSIRRFTENLNPRGARVVALSKPNDTERGQWYFQRYVQHLPTAGEIVFFDRSWYNRGGVEIVMGFCTPQEYGEFFRQVPGFERSIVESGTHLFKLWFAVSRKNQKKRFEDRRTDPLRQWKMSPIDEAALSKWDDYTRARDAMLVHSDNPTTPWTVVNSNEKKRARLESIRHVLHTLDYDHKDHDVAHAPDPYVVQAAASVMSPTGLPTFE